jgi:mannose PTS system EIIA component
MIGVVVVTHGRLATELLNAAEMIVGEMPNCVAVSIGWHDDVNDAREQIVKAVDRIRSSSGVLILTDMQGGTPSNFCIPLIEAGKVEVITGVNLPMLIKMKYLREASDLLAVARQVQTEAKTAIFVASDVMRPL